MKKYVGVIVAGILVAGVSYGFMGIKAEKKETPTKPQSSGISFPDMMSQLSRNMSIWTKLTSDEKKQAVGAVINLFKNRNNIAILNDAAFYSGKIDETLRTNPASGNLDIMAILRILAIMEYDFYNGENKDELAKKTLGEKGFEQNQLRRRYGNVGNMPAKQ